MSATKASVGSGRTVIVGPVRYDELCVRGRRLLLDHGFTLIENDSTRPWTAEQMAELIITADAAVAGVEVYDADILSRASSLRIISRLGVGLDNVDLAEARARGVDVVNVPGGNANAVAELVIGMMLSAMRRMGPMDLAVKSGSWDRFVGREVAGKTIGLLGFGAIAQMVARRLAGFDVTIRAFDPYGDGLVAEALGVELASLEETVAEADVVSVHVPHTPETHHLVDEELIGKMRAGVVIINASRGGTVDEAALVDGLTTGRVSSAGLDVFEVEPVSTDNPLLAFDSVVGAPHAAADSEEAYDRIGLATAQAIVDVFSGREPVNVAN